MQSIRTAHSLDADGCFFNLNYILNDTHLNKLIPISKKLLDANFKLIQSILSTIQEHKSTKNHLFLGSNRQSFSTEVFNIRQGENGGGSAFAAMEIFQRELSQHASIELDCFLMADIFGNKPSGTSFQRGLEAIFRNQLSETKTHSIYVFDHEKVSLLYAQMHKLASENTDTSFAFYFYDNSDRILTSLENFYTKNPDLIPKTVTLHIQKYEGDDVEPKKIIQGTGIIDPYYRASVKLMAHQLFHHLGAGGPGVNPVMNLNTHEFKIERDAMHLVNNRFFQAESELKKILTEPPPGCHLDLLHIAGKIHTKIISSSAHTEKVYRRELIQLTELMHAMTESLRSHQNHWAAHTLQLLAIELHEQNPKPKNNLKGCLLIFLGLLFLLQSMKFFMQFNHHSAMDELITQQTFISENLITFGMSLMSFGVGATLLMSGTKDFKNNNSDSFVSQVGLFCDELKKFNSPKERGRSCFNFSR